MSSSKAQLEGGPIQLNLAAQDGTKPYDYISGILTLLHHKRGREEDVRLLQAIQNQV